MSFREASINLVMAEGVSLAASVTTGIKAINISGLSIASVQAIWTGTPTGTFNFLQSNHPNACSADGTVLDLTKFTILPPPTGFTAQQPAGVANTGQIGFFGFADLAGEWLLASYTSSSGTGTLTSLRGVAH